MPPEELRNADEIFISSTAGGVIGVTRLDGRILSNDRPGPVTANLRDAYWRFRREGWCNEPIDYTWRWPPNSRRHPARGRGAVRRGHGGERQRHRRYHSG